MKSVFLLLLLLPAVITAQKKEGKLYIDSLQNELLKTLTDTGKVTLLNKISWHYSRIDFNEGIRYGHLALKLSQKNKWNTGIGFAYYNIASNYLTHNVDSAFVYLELSAQINKTLHNSALAANLYYGYGAIYQTKLQNPQALESYQKALELSEQVSDKSMRALCLLSIGIVWNSLSNTLKALEFLHKGLNVAEQTDDPFLIGMAYASIGNVYFYFDNNHAIENYRKAIENYQLVDSKEIIGLNFTNIGLVEANQLQYKNALIHHQAALKIFREMDAKGYEGLALGNIGYVYDKMNNYAKALEYYKQALSLDKKGLKTGMIDDLNGIGSIYNRMHDSDMVKIGELPSTRHKTALDYAMKCLAAARESGTADKQSDAWQLLSEIYERQNNPQKAFDAYKNFIVFRDSNVNKVNNQELTRRDMQFGFDKKQLSDSLKNEETKKIAHYKLQKQRTYTFGAFAGVAMLLLLSFFIFKNYNTQKKSNKLLAFEKDKSESLLLNILPAEVAEELKVKGYADAKHFDLVTVLFSDFVNFTGAAEKMSPKELVAELDDCFKAFDEIVGKHRIEKIKTIGDAYMAVCGLPISDPMHAKNIMAAALEIRDFMAHRNAVPGSRSFNIRIGIHSGAVVAGIVGTKKFAYDIWGDTVNTAARMEQNSEKGKINISEKSYELVKDEFECIYRGELTAKNKGAMKMYFLESNKVDQPC